MLALSNNKARMQDSLARNIQVTQQTRRTNLRINNNRTIKINRNNMRTTSFTSRYQIARRGPTRLLEMCHQNTLLHQDNTR